MVLIFADLSPGEIAVWVGTHGKNIALVLGLVLMGNRIMSRLLPPAVARTVLREATPATEIDLRKRADTLSTVLLTTGRAAIFIVGGVMLLDEFGFNVGPFLTGLGIGGIAVGLGAQSLIRDTINGVLILAENQYGRGDLVTLAGVQGWVEEVNLRRTVLRDIEGTLYTVPNSEVKVAANLTRGYSGVNVLIPIIHSSDIERATTIIDGVGRDLADDAQIGHFIVDPPRAARVETLTDKGVTIRVLGRAAPGAQFEVAGALRRRIKHAFDEAGIYFGEPPASPPPPVSPSAAPGPPRPLG